MHVLTSSNSPYHMNAQYGSCVCAIQLYNHYLRIGSKTLVTPSYYNKTAMAAAKLLHYA
jgi:hypothetical protein